MRDNSFFIALFLVVSILGISIQNCFAQVQTVGNPTIADVLPPSPNASSLGEYGETPVSLSTGIINISIPMYTAELNGLSLPISLSYSSSGVKVDDQASRVGLGALWKRMS